MLARSGGGGGALAAGLPVYGASQVGAVLRYRLGAGDWRPDAYMRGVAALNGSGERGLAAGLWVRLPGLPLRLAGEARADRFIDGRVHLRPAVFAVTEMPRLPLAEGFSAETYLQGGFVGGAAATPFIDGQLRVDRPMARLGAGAVRVGAGVWGGAERGSGRLDLGPAASVTAASGPAAMRLAIDWRLRVVGAAAPGSGPTLTLATSF